MTQGDIILIEMPQRDGRKKRRPALVLKVLPPFDDCLICGISTQLHQEVEDFDYILEKGSAGFEETGLKSDSLIRLGFITTISKSRIPGVIGHLPTGVHDILIGRLRRFLMAEAGSRV